jgi:hypothetical protein
MPQSPLTTRRRGCLDKDDYEAEKRDKAEEKELDDLDSGWTSDKWNIEQI